MSELVVGLSYRTAPIGLLERAALGRAAAAAPGGRSRAGGEHVAEAVVLSTCNRLEVYADVSRFHGGVDDVGEALAAATGIPLAELTAHLYVHYEDGGRDPPVRGRLRAWTRWPSASSRSSARCATALRVAQDAGSAGRSLGALLQRALRVGKRAHSETDSTGPGRRSSRPGSSAPPASLGPLAGAQVLVVGAGTMSGLAVATLQRAGVARLAVANRTPERAERLAGRGRGARRRRCRSCPRPWPRPTSSSPAPGRSATSSTAELAAAAAADRQRAPAGVRRPRAPAGRRPRDLPASPA